MKWYIICTHVFYVYDDNDDVDDSDDDDDDDDEEEEEDDDEEEEEEADDNREEEEDDDVYTHGVHSNMSWHYPQKAWLIDLSAAAIENRQEHMCSELQAPQPTGAANGWALSTSAKQRPISTEWIIAKIHIPFRGISIVVTTLWHHMDRLG